MRQKKAYKAVVENGGIVSTAMVEAGYSPETAKTPQKLTGSLGWKELVKEHLDDNVLLKKHTELLNSTRLDHMVFPLGPQEGEPEETEMDEADLPKDMREFTTLTDNDIKELLLSVNCKVRKIVHGRQARHVYFWAYDNKSRKEALDMAYKLKGSYAPEKSVNVNMNVVQSDNPELETIRKEFNEKARQAIIDKIKQ